MKLKAVDGDIKFDPGGTSYESVNLFELHHEKLLVLLCSFLILSLSHFIYWLVNGGLKRMFEEMP